MSHIRDDEHVLNLRRSLTGEIALNDSRVGHSKAIVKGATVIAVVGTYDALTVMLLCPSWISVCRTSSARHQQQQQPEGIVYTIDQRGGGRRVPPRHVNRCSAWHVSARR